MATAWSAVWPLSLLPEFSALSPLPAAAAAALDFLLVTALAHAVYTDLRARRISNRLTLATALTGVVMNALIGGWVGLTTSALGCLVGFAVLLAPYLAGGIGAGDLKLLAAIGAVKGSQFILRATLYTGIAGGVLALIYLAYVVCTRVAAPLFRRAGQRAPSQGVRSASHAAIPYAPAIAIGAMLALLLP